MGHLLINCTVLYCWAPTNRTEITDVGEGPSTCRIVDGTYMQLETSACFSFRGGNSHEAAGDGVEKEPSSPSGRTRRIREDLGSVNKQLAKPSGASSCNEESVKVVLAWLAGWLVLAATLLRRWYPHTPFPQASARLK